jgi:hypothetical protein
VPSNFVRTYEDGVARADGAGGEVLRDGGRRAQGGGDDDQVEGALAAPHDGQTDSLPEGKQQQGHTDTSEIETPRVGKAIMPVMSLGMGSKCGTAGMRWNGGWLVLRPKFLT